MRVVNVYIVFDTAHHPYKIYEAEGNSWWEEKSNGLIPLDSDTARALVYEFYLLPLPS